MILTSSYPNKLGSVRCPNVTVPGWWKNDGHSAVQVHERVNVVLSAARIIHVAVQDLNFSNKIIKISIQTDQLW